MVTQTYRLPAKPQPLREISGHFASLAELKGCSRYSRITGKSVPRIRQPFCSKDLVNTARIADLRRPSAPGLDTRILGLDTRREIVK